MMFTLASVSTLMFITNANASSEKHEVDPATGESCTITDDDAVCSVDQSKNSTESIESKGKKGVVNNLHIIDEDLQSGFAIYRYGISSEAGIKELCKMGISEVAVLSGDAEKSEIKYKDDCPSLKVIYNEQQTAKSAIDKKFLDFFDQWVLSAKASGKKIAFRCSCGCHRTGRLAAYYQMKYQDISTVDANIVMKEHGKYMFLFPQLPYQVSAMKDYILGRPCSQDDKYCVKQ